ncbi:MAG: SDR family NAD(P)-dependent oxidoreductase [Magnetococcales bacterium]|nr:SDR family NAD(P)-dependent oxidoreductase [Magnetococcales bacterium]
MADQNPDSDRRTVLITGSASGIGKEAALTLHKRGWRVFASVRNPADIPTMMALGLEAVHLDLADSRSIDCAVDWLLQRTNGTLYALFNNGAYAQPGAVEDIPRNALRAQFETNLFGTHELTTRLLPAMIAAGEGRIVQNSSVLGFVALKYRGAYVSSKYALEGLSDALRLELRGTGVHLSLIEPGPIRTGFRQRAREAYQRNIVPVLSRHREAYATLEHRLNNEEFESRYTLGPEAVVSSLIHALESDAPKIRYHVTTPTRIFSVMKRLFPQSMLDNLLAKVQ